MSAKARSARRCGYHGARFDKDLEQTAFHGFQIDLLGSGNDDATHVGGDLFALQLTCFDAFLCQRENADPVLDRFMRFLRINPGLDSQKIMGDRAKCLMMETIWTDIDRSRLRSGEKEFVAQVLALCLVSLVGAVVDSALHAERSEEIRKELVLRLDIVRRGSEKGEGQ